MPELPRQSDGRQPSYYVEIHGDDDRLIADDIVEVVESHWRVDARVAAPLELKVTIRGPYGETRAYAHTWEPVGNLTVTTGLTREDLEGVSATAELGPMA